MGFHSMIFGFHSHKLECFFSVWINRSVLVTLETMRYRVCQKSKFVGITLSSVQFHTRHPLFPHPSFCTKWKCCNNIVRSMCLCVCALHLSRHILFVPLYWFLFRHSDKRKILQKKTFNMFCGDVWLIWCVRACWLRKIMIRWWARADMVLT